MTEIGFGVIGLGRIGGFHASSLQHSVSGARLVAAAVDPAQRETLLSSGAAPCDLAEDVAALLARPDVDAIVVASPAVVHDEHIALAADAGKPIFSEKPLADSVAKAEMAAASVRNAGVPFQIGFQRRYDPSYARARELIAAGAIGDVEMFRGISCDRLGPIDFLRTSGGIFMDLASHDFDAARFLTGEEIIEVFAIGAVLVEPELATFDDVDHAVVLLRFANGALGVVQNAWRAPYGYDIRAEVHGSKGKVVAEVDEKYPTTLYDNRGKVSERHDQFVERFSGAYRAELQAFVDALHAGVVSTPGIDDGLQAVRVAAAATRSRREGRWIPVNDN
ncbi:MAG: inositol 2-dehydrogenase [Chloroflexia bacterium]|nr:inositol 2-dehydrogenase [Chloroflexia bacterium]